MSVPVPTPNPPPTPVPTPAPKPSIDWKAIATLIASIVAALFVGPHVVPTPTPTPTPVPPNVVPVPTPTPQPTPIPVPNPTPTPLPGPTSNIVVTDANGNTINGGVIPGTLFTVTAAAGTSLYGIPSQPNQASIVQVSDSKLICTLQAGGTLQVVAYGQGRPSLTTITTNQQLPNPPPTPTPSPQPNPTPNPPPVPPAPSSQRKLTISVVVDSKNMPPAVATLLNNFTAWSGFASAGHNWIRFDPTTTETKGIAAVSALKAGNIGTGTQGVVFTDQSTGTVVYAGPVPPTIDALKSLVSQYSGGSV